MKKCIVVTVLLLGMVSVSGALALDDESPLSVGLAVGYFMPAENDLDNGLSYGLRLSYEVSDTAAIDLEADFASSDVENTTLDADYLFIHLNYILHAQDKGGEKNLFYYGAGLTMSEVDLPVALVGANIDSKPDKFGGNIILGYEITDKFCFEVRYSIIGDETLGGAIGTLDMGGIAGMVRVRF
ncbi:MAG: hypothetical protein QGH40_06585 [bacterium]|jgi:hypothetical protein|nr:hypothetical protein [bacterium]